jgi:hypothetical protein
MHQRMGREERGVMPKQTSTDPVDKGPEIIQALAQQAGSEISDASERVIQECIMTVMISLTVAATIGDKAVSSVAAQISRAAAISSRAVQIGGNDVTGATPEMMLGGILAASWGASS